LKVYRLDKGRKDKGIDRDKEKEGDKAPNKALPFLANPGRKYPEPEPSFIEPAITLTYKEIEPAARLEPSTEASPSRIEFEVDQLDLSGPLPFRPSGRRPGGVSAPIPQKNFSRIFSELLMPSQKISGIPTEPLYGIASIIPITPPTTIIREYDIPIVIIGTPWVDSFYETETSYDGL